MKVLIIGLDAASIDLAERFMEEGRMPFLHGLLPEGLLFKRVLSEFPTLTPTNWTSLATGASPMTHGVTDFTVHLPGTPLDQAENGFDSRLNQAETLFEAAGRAGKRSVLLKFSGTWPPGDFPGAVVDGCIPGCRHHLLGDHLIVTRGESSGAGGQPACTLPRDGAERRVLRLSWTPDGRDLAASMPLTSFDGRRIEVHLRWKPDGLCLAVGRGPVHRLEEGAWTGPIRVAFGEEPAAVTHVLAKPLKMDPGRKALRLYLSMGMPEEGWSHPPSLAPSLVRHAGPFFQGPAVEAAEKGWIDPDTFCEFEEHRFAWFAKAASWLMEEEEWDLFAMQYHGIDHASHLWLNQADPAISPDTSHEFLDRLGRLYQGADQLIEKLRRSAGGEVLLSIVSDHGVQSCTHALFPEQGMERTYAANRILEEAGLLVRDAEGKAVWERTQAYTSTDSHIFVNLKGRDPDGIVPGDRYDAVVGEIISALRAFREPVTGKCPFALALPRRDAALLGTGGERSGDVVYAVDAPFGYIHGQALPTSRHGISSLTPLLFLHGPGVRHDPRLENRPGSLRDVAPTLCRLAGLPFPRHCEGNPLL